MKKIANIILLPLILLVGILFVGCNNHSEKTFSKFGISVSLSNDWQVSIDNDLQYILYRDNKNIGHFEIFKHIGPPSDGTNIENVTNEDEMKEKVIAYENFASGGGSIMAPRMHYGDAATFAYGYWYRYQGETLLGGGMIIIMQTPDNIGWFSIKINGNANFDESDAFEIAKTIKTNFI